mmetsp:Transcript_17368/g.32454  ORF Transcript_17368/g.32454 Transcript_17368/m.32454 type:complete len:227 (-) Transcript_17368:114-794(-)
MIGYEFRIFIGCKFGEKPSFRSQDSQSCRWFNDFIAYILVVDPPRLWHEMRAGLIVFVRIVLVGVDYFATISIRQFLDRCHGRRRTESTVIIHPSHWVIKVARGISGSGFKGSGHARNLGQNDLHQPSQRRGTVPVSCSDTDFQILFKGRGTTQIRVVVIDCSCHTDTFLGPSWHSFVQTSTVVRIGNPATSSTFVVVVVAGIHIVDIICTALGPTGPMSGGQKRK